jgi:hypothetical protein
MTTSLSCHGCRYIDFLRVAKAENEDLIWPTGANTSAFDDMDQFNIELNLVGITPDAREVAFLFDLSPGGIYAHDSEPGMLDIDGDMSLVVSLGHQALDAAMSSAIKTSSSFPKTRFPCTATHSMNTKLKWS